MYQIIGHIRSLLSVRPDHPICTTRAVPIASQPETALTATLPHTLLHNGPWRQEQVRPSCLVCKSEFVPYCNFHVLSIFIRVIIKYFLIYFSPLLYASVSLIRRAQVSETGEFKVNHHLSFTFAIAISYYISSLRAHSAFCL